MGIVSTIPEKCKRCYTCEQLQQSHKELSEAQQRLVHTEKLASMGQIFAGVAHEINNPLGTILLHVTCEMEDEFPPMMIDGEQIQQMLVNLIDNGIDAITSNNGVVNIKVRLNTRKDSVKIEVKDNGYGIPPENLSKLFTPFFTTKEMGKGTGLGLAIAYGIVKMHSGDISVESKEGQGTTFFIRLPVGSEEIKN